MSLREQIQQDQKEAMKARDEMKTSSLRMLWAAVKNAEIEKKEELTNEEIQAIITRQVKQLKDALKDFTAGGRMDLAGQNEKEISLLSSYLPEQMSDEDLKKIVQSTIEKVSASSPADIGKVMGAVMQEVKGQADGNRVREVVSSLLN